MRDDLDILLTSSSVELTGRLDDVLERQLSWLRCWYGKAPLYLGRRVVLERQTIRRVV